MHAGTDSGGKMTFFEPGEDTFGGRLEKEFKQVRMKFKEIPEIVRDGEGDMVVFNVR